MTVYARSDLSYVTISRDHGGCGEGHGRPVENGAPVKLWALTCHGGCEDHLRHDALWASQPHTVPETPDETTVREDVEKRGSVEQADAVAHALTDLARLGELPRALAEALSKSLAPLVGGAQTTVTAGEPMMQLCPNGHGNNPAARFCSQCGVPVDEPVSSSRGKALPPADPGPSVPDAGPPEDWREMPLADLKELARGLGVKTTRSREDQVAALAEHFGEPAGQAAV